MPTYRLLLLLLALCSTPAPASGLRPGKPADLALGDPGPGRNMSSPSGIAVDPVTKKVFVADTFHHRVLRFASAEALQNDGEAESVFGQPDFNAAGSNLSPQALNQPKSLVCDGQDRVWVADTANHRVLLFANCNSAPPGPAAVLVLGQPNYSTNAKGKAANQMYSPTDVAVAPDGSLYVADSQNHRVLRFNAAHAKPAGGDADAALGQPNLDANAPGGGPAKMVLPLSVEIQPSPGGGLPERLWVADAVNHRVLGFDNPGQAPTGASASAVLGQPDLVSNLGALTASSMQGPSGLALTGNVLWVVDGGHRRALGFYNAATRANGAPADLVLGQLNFTTDNVLGPDNGLRFPAGCAADGGRLWIADSGRQRIIRHEAAASKGNGNNADGSLGSPSAPWLGQQDARSFSDPRGIAIDPTLGKLFVCDTPNNRVLRFPNAAALRRGDAAEAVFGQASFTTRASATGANGLTSPVAVAVDASGRLWVADAGNHRVLRFDNALFAPSGSLAAHVLGQPDFTSDTDAATAAGMANPAGLAVEYFFQRNTGVWITTRLWVADVNNNRVLRYDSPASLPNGAAANAVLGQPNFTASAESTAATGMSLPQGLAVDSTGRLWVADYGNIRILRFDAARLKPAGAAADGLLMQTAFGPAAPFLPGNPAMGKPPRGLCVDARGRLFVAQENSDRVVWFEDAATLTPGSPADGVLGQTSFAENNIPNIGPAIMKGCTACAIDPRTQAVWVSDSSNGRLLRFPRSVEALITPSPSLQQPTHLLLTFTGPAGERLMLQSSPDLETWTDMQSLPTTTGGTGSWTTPFGPQPYFYRLRAR